MVDDFYPQSSETRDSILIISSKIVDLSHEEYNFCCNRKLGLNPTAKTMVVELQANCLASLSFRAHI